MDISKCVESYVPWAYKMADFGRRWPWKDPDDALSTALESVWIAAKKLAPAAEKTPVKGIAALSMFIFKRRRINSYTSKHYKSRVETISDDVLDRFSSGRESPLESACLAETFEEINDLRKQVVKGPGTKVLPCGNPDCRTKGGYIQANRIHPVRVKGLCSSCHGKLCKKQKRRSSGPKRDNLLAFDFMKPDENRPCASCGTRKGYVAKGRSRPFRARGLCHNCHKRSKRRAAGVKSIPSKEGGVPWPD